MANSEIRPRPSVLVVMHDGLAPAGLIGQTIVEAGGRTTAVLPHERYSSACPGAPAGLPDDDRGFDGMVILGGAMHAADDRGFPHFEALIRLIRRFHDQGKPVLGICLGAQLVGRAFGARVVRQGFLEIGLEQVMLTRDAADDPLLCGLAPTFFAMQWHEDAVELPAGARHLASSARCMNQIFRLGRATYGFQGHIEVTPDIVRSWVRSRAAFLRENEPSFLDGFERSFERHMRSTMQIGRTVASRWLGLMKADRDEEAA